MMQGLYKQAIVQLSNLQCSLVSSTLFTGDVSTVGKGRHWDPPLPIPPSNYVIISSTATTGAIIHNHRLSIL